MFILSFVFFISIVFLFLFYFINFFLSNKLLEKNKVSSFESGFVSVGKVQNSFSIHFFVIMLMFVIFDLEVVMLIGLLVSDFNSFFSFIMLLFFVLGGFYMEWWYGKLIWII
uniref:NADH-ubiquinone oxidoreductase chain 3 n=2 Tax=Steinernema TaxID=34507 RepID=A0A1E1G7B8_STECR|nr:NADH dehydrogenase subunit 3 [Steinernema abbasi]AYV63099.1 NADH dehydrogenase subunit 3 [Steinernema abbasi]QAA11075.1 NADH dehydrogenase subunit 3 [Steinernema carpocapsae]BAV78648.1 NADH dehydrogenase subunit 3 [Steinernema carpocapsae]